MEMDWGKLSQLASEHKFENIPPGDYLMEILEATHKLANTGTGTMINFKCKILEGAHAGRTTWASLFVPNPNADVKPASFGMLQRRLQGLGMSFNDLAAAGSSLDDVMPVFVGKTFIGVMKIEVWQGEERTKVSDFKAIPGAGASASGMPPSAPVQPSTPFDKSSSTGEATATVNPFAS